MKLQEYISKLNEIAQKYPDAEVVYAKDAEGNGFKKVVFDPSVGFYDRGEFVSDDSSEESNQPNAVCLN